MNFVKKFFPQVEIFNNETTISKKVLFGEGQKNVEEAFKEGQNYPGIKVEIIAEVAVIRTFTGVIIEGWVRR